jgi:hypothetical protein
MPELSDAALALLKRHGDRDDVRVDDSNRGAHRELETAGLVVLSRPFVGEPKYLLSKTGWKLVEVLDHINGPSPARSAAPRA